MFQELWQGIKHIFSRLFAVMKNNDRSRPAIVNYIVKALLRRNFLAKIKRQNRPHDNSVLHLQVWNMSEIYSSIRRPEKNRVYQSAAFFDIIVILIPGCFPAIKMIVGVVSCPVTFLKQQSVHFRISFNILSDTKEGSLCLIIIKDFQHTWSDLRVWPIIESKEDLLLIRFDFPGQLWKYHPE